MEWNNEAYPEALGRCYVGVEDPQRETAGGGSNDNLDVSFSFVLRGSCWRERGGGPGGVAGVAVKHAY